MKKIVFGLLILAAAGNLSAQLNIRGSVDMALVPYQWIQNYDAEPEEEDMVMGAGAGRYGSGQGIRGRLDVRASKDDLVGIRMRIQARGDGIGIEDYLQAWWQPLDWLRLDAGRFLDDRLRGKISDDEKWNAYTIRMYDGDAIFSRFKTHWSGQAGFLASITPIENLYVGAMLYGLSPFTASNSSISAAALFDSHPDMVTDNADAFSRIQLAAAYTVSDVLLIRAQYLGAKPHVDINRITDEIMDTSGNLIKTYDFNTFSITAPRIEAAVAFTGIPGLTLDVGGKIPLPFKKWSQSPSDILLKEDEELLDIVYKTYRDGFIWQAPYQVSAGAQYIAGPFNAAARVDAKFGGSVKGNTDEFRMGPELNVHVWPSYDLGFASVCLDFGYEFIGASYDKNDALIGKDSAQAMNGGHRFGVGLSLQKNILDTFLVKGGVAYKFAGTVNSVREKAVLTIPVYLEYTF